jgi:hypothetical protein
MVTMCVADGVALSAAPANGTFEIGTPPLPFVSGTTTVTDAAGKASTTLAAATTCVVACCPFTNGMGCTGAAVTGLCP